MAHILMAMGTSAMGGAISTVLLKAQYEVSRVENCARAYEIIGYSPDEFDLVILCDLHARYAKNGAWLADVLSREHPNLPVMIITDESPTAGLYREAELATARMVDQRALVSTEALLSEVTKLIEDG